MAKETKIRQSARGQLCQVRIPSVCKLDNTETTVMAHIKLPGYSGIGIKPKDIHATYACSNCHDVMDGRVKSSFLAMEIEVMALQGMYRTLSMLIDAGLIVIPSQKTKKYLGEDTTDEWLEKLGA